MSKRLSAEDWVEAGLRALGQQGFEALKADLLAKALSVSRGSFYWHFSDVDTFHDAVLERWRVRATEAVITDIQGQNAPEDRLPALLRRALRADLRIESAIRAWAFSNNQVHNKVELVDRQRLAYLEKLLTTRNTPKGQARAKAQLIHWTYVGFAVAAGHDRTWAQIAPVFDQLVALAGLDV
jgi:AcrR family transcriptional regulator